MRFPLVRTFITIIMLSSVACNQVDVFTPEFRINQSSFTDEELLKAEYTPYKYPDEFYHEERRGSISYQNAAWVEPRPENQDWLCTDDKSKALEWSEYTSKRLSYYREITNETETEKYFEFIRVYSENQEDVILDRTHKCSYIDTRDKNMFAKDGTIGYFNQRPINERNVKELIEYLWFIQYYNIGGHKVLSSISHDGEKINQTLYEIETTHGDWNLRDEITLVRTSYVVDKNSGEINKTRDEIRTIFGHSN